MFVSVGEVFDSILEVIWSSSSAVIMILRRIKSKHIFLYFNKPLNVPAMDVYPTQVKSLLKVTLSCRNERKSKISLGSTVCPGAYSYFNIDQLGTVHKK